MTRGGLAAVLVAAAVMLGGAGGPGARLRLLGHPARRRPRARAAPAKEPVPWALVLDLLVAVLAAGASVTGALRAVGSELAEVGDPSAAAVLDLAAVLELGPGPAPVLAPTADASPVPDHVRELHDVLTLSLRTGMAPVPLVAAAADTRRRRRAQAQALAAQRLGVLVVLPTGLCLLPALVLLTVAPLVLDLLTRQ